MSRRTYTECEQAFVAFTLQLNQNNVRRTSKETGVSPATIRDWRKKWEEEGYPDSEDFQEALPALREDFIQSLQDVRWQMVEKLQKKVEIGDPSVRDLIYGIGIITDKINVAQGVKTNKETVIAVLPDSTALAEQLVQFVEKTVTDAQRRREVIEDAEYEPVESKQLALSS